MISVLPRDALAAYLGRQLSHFFPDREMAPGELQPAVDDALARLARCFAGIADKYLPAGGEPRFDHRHTDHYAMFLYLVANSAHRLGAGEVAAKAYALNKALHALDAFYEVELPEVFLFQHPVGTVLGRARYGNYLMVYQRCTVGAKNREYPELGEGVVLYAGSSVIGRCRLGDNVWLSTGSLVLGQDVPGDSVVFGQSPALVVKPARRRVVGDLFKPLAE
ncbi:MAG: hypothetical protein JNM82_04450 [Rhodocyclaceae bacterium]|nr:hypothetical protein [Rhodocyclaceae bacterium]